MATYVITHEVDDVEHWLSSPKREEVFGPMGITVRTFRDPGGSNRAALIAEIPDLFGPGFTAQMTYYETKGGAKVFSAGAFTLAGRALEPGVPQVLANLWARLGRP